MFEADLHLGEQFFDERAPEEVLNGNPGSALEYLVAQTGVGDDIDRAEVELDLMPKLVLECLLFLHWRLP